MTRGYKTPPDQRPSDAELKRLYIEEKMTVQQIADLSGHPAGSIYGWMRAANIPRRKAGRPKTPLENRVPVPLDDLRRMYEDDELTAAEIASKFDVSPGLVIAWLNEMGVKMRPTTGTYPYEDGWRRIASTEDVPYDKTFDGKVLTVRMEILECGHKIRPFKKWTSHQREHVNQTEFRRCYRCVPKETEDDGPAHASPRRRADRADR